MWFICKKDTQGGCIMSDRTYNEDKINRNRKTKKRRVSDRDVSRRVNAGRPGKRKQTGEGISLATAPKNRRRPAESTLRESRRSSSGDQSYRRRANRYERYEKDRVNRTSNLSGDDREDIDDLLREIDETGRAGSSGSNRRNTGRPAGSSSSVRRRSPRRGQTSRRPVSSINRSQERSSRDQRSRDSGNRNTSDRSSSNRKSSAGRRNRRRVDTGAVLSRVLAVMFVLLIIVMVILAIRSVVTKGSGNNNSVGTESGSELNVSSSSVEEAGTAAETTGTSSVTILGTGDNLIHEALYEHAQTAGGYDFTPYYQYVKPYIQAADIATVNQESPLATAIADPSGYPLFDTPTEDGDALIDAGFDIINQANNHALDMGEEGASATLDYWDSKGIAYVGLYRNEEDMRNIRIIEKNGIKTAFLGFTDITNEPLSTDSEIQMPMLTDEDLVRELIETARSEADFVVVHAHWGEEGEEECNTDQEQMAQKMVDWGADLIFGNHPHILQKLDVLTRAGDGARCPVLYSGGNFLSGQQSRNQLISGLLTVKVTKDNATGQVAAETMNFMPVVTHYVADREDTVIYPVSQYTEQLAKLHGVEDYDGEPMTLDYINQVIAANIPAQYLNKDGFLSQYSVPTGRLPSDNSLSSDSSENSSRSDDENSSGSYDESYGNSYDNSNDESYDGNYDESYDESYDETYSEDSY